MIPKKKRRTITVDEVKYEYCISRGPSVFIKNLTSLMEIDWNKDIEDYQITPKDIRELILTESLFGRAAKIKIVGPLITIDGPNINRYRGGNRHCDD